MSCGIEPAQQKFKGLFWHDFIEVVSENEDTRLQNILDYTRRARVALRPFCVDDA